MACHDANVRFVSTAATERGAPSAWTWAPPRSRRWPSTPTASCWPGPGCPTGWSPPRPTPSSTTWPGPGAGGPVGPSPRSRPSSTARPPGWWSPRWSRRSPPSTAGAAPAAGPALRGRPGRGSAADGGGGRHGRRPGGEREQGGACWPGRSASIPGPSATGTARPWPPTPCAASRRRLGHGHVLRRPLRGAAGTRRRSTTSGVAEGQLPVVGPMGSGDRHAARTADRLRRRVDRCVLRADRGRSRPARRRPGHLRGHPDRLGGDRGVEDVPGLTTLPNMVAGQVMIGGPSNAGALFADWVQPLVGAPGPTAPAGGTDHRAEERRRPGPGAGVASLPAGRAHAVPRSGAPGQPARSRHLPGAGGAGPRRPTRPAGS